MLRDSKRSKDYFDNYIIKEYSRVTKYNEWLENGKVAEERILPVIDGRGRLKLNIVIAKYSRGDEIASLRNDFLDFTTDFFSLDNERFFSYTRNLEILSIAVLLDMPLDLIQRIEKRNYQRDGLTEFLVNGTQNLSMKSVSFPKGWQALFDIVFLADKMQQQEQLKRYINNVWAVINEEEGAFESHKNMKVNSYKGYWCFEAAAVAKLLDIPDENLKDSQYYPYDLAHFCV